MHRTSSRRMEELAPPPPPPLRVAVAFTGSRKSALVIKWALESFISDGKVLFKLLHVRAPVRKSTDQDDNTMLRCFPGLQAQEDIVETYKRDLERQTVAMLLPFKQICSQRKVEIDVTVIEGDDIADAIMKEIAKTRITKLVIGSSPRTMFTRRVKRNSISSRIMKGAASFCAVYVVLKGNLSTMRPPNPEGESESDAVNPYSRCSSFAASSCIEPLDNGSIDEEFAFSPATDTTGRRQFDKVYTLNDNASWIPFGTERHDVMRISDKGSSLEASKRKRTNMFDEGSTLQATTDNGSREFGSKPFHKRFTSDTTTDTTGSRKFDKGFSFDAAFDTVSRVFSNLSTFEENGLKISDKGSTFDAALGTTQSMLPAKVSTYQDKGSSEFSSKGFTLEVATKIFDQITILEAPPSSSSLESEVDLVLELEGLGVDRRLLDTIYGKAQETIDASSQKKNNASKRWTEQTVKPKKVTTFKEDSTRELARPEKEEDYESVKQKEAENMKKWVEAEANSDAKEERKLDKATILRSDELCNMLTWEDIVSATSSFSNDLLIGMGTIGSVYKCKLRHTTAAVKVLHSKESRWTKKFHQELEILSNICHPHLLLLLGACPDHGCLVYEYMEKGSLDDRLLRKDNTPPIPWFERYRIAWEVASALLFLHNAKPKPIVHRDLKPANILLDHNYVSKIGDVGLSRLLPADTATVFNGTRPVGTLCYIDPEYQRTGMISPKSDVYAFGMVILQLLTAKPAIALTRIVKKALDNGQLMDILDLEAGNWPVKETQELAALGLSCTELRRYNRPGLKTGILPVLEKMKGIAERARDSLPCAPLTHPQYFVCPILQDVMDEPCVAADGYTYERKAIELWLKDNDTSPITNRPIPNKNLLPNFTLISAIMDWKSRKQ